LHIFFILCRNIIATPQVKLSLLLSWNIIKSVIKYLFLQKTHLYSKALFLKVLPNRIFQLPPLTRTFNIHSAVLLKCACLRQPAIQLFRSSVTARSTRGEERKRKKQVIVDSFLSCANSAQYFALSRHIDISSTNRKWSSLECIKINMIIYLP